MSVPASMRLSDGSLPYVEVIGCRRLVYRAMDGEYVCPKCANSGDFRTPQKVPSFATIREYGVDPDFILVEVADAEVVFDGLDEPAMCAHCSATLWENEP